MLTENRDKLDLIAKRLIEKEVIDIEATRVLLGMAPVIDEHEQPGATAVLPEHLPSAQNPKSQVLPPNPNEKKPI